MKLFSQLTLVSAIAISGNAMAMQALDDATLGDATGQEGITIAVTAPGTGFTVESVVIHDADGRTGNGLTSVGPAKRGAIVLGSGVSQFRLNTGAATPIVFDIDADGNGTAPVLNINVALPSTFSIDTGDIAVASSTGVGNAVTNNVVVIDSFNIALGGAALNIQLGNEVQGAMIVASGTINGGLNINNFSLRDAGGATSGGGIHFGNINIKDTGAANLTLGARVDANTAGLIITSTGPNSDITLTNVRLGATTAPAVGNIELLGLNTANTQIRISGH